MTPRRGCLSLAPILLLGALDAQRQRTADRPPKFAPGQVWSSCNAAGDESVQFAVLATGSLRDVGRVVTVRVSGAPPLSLAPEHTREALRLMFACVYPESILARHADELVATLQPELFAAERSDAAWREAFYRGDVGVRTISPFLWSGRRRAIMQRFADLEARLPAYLPEPESAPAKKAVAGPRLRIGIVVVAAGERVGNKLEGRRVAYRVGPRRCADLASLSDLVQTVRAALGREPIVVIGPGAQSVYGDVATVVDALSAIGVEKIVFAGGKGAGAKPGSTGAGSKDIDVAALLKSARAEVSLAAGQAWEYRVPKGETPGRLVVLRVEKVVGLGEVAFVRFEGLTVPENEFGLAVDSVAMWGRTLRRYLADQVGTGSVPADVGVGIAQWRAAFAAGQVGYLTTSPWKFASTCRDVARKKKLEDLILPPAKKR